MNKHDTEELVNFEKIITMLDPWNDMEEMIAQGQIITHGNNLLFGNHTKFHQRKHLTLKVPLDLNLASLYEVKT